MQATGKLEASESVSVGAQESGQITALHVANGDRVEKGQLIAEIDDSNQINELRIAQAALRVFEAQRAASGQSSQSEKSHADLSAPAASVARGRQLA